ncbi:MAG TPA: hypothetical protein VKP58_16695 [Candidatus Acidoferrum sp.]|jgi:hypothetical protein|nr:hypothetical protein [Candidatus Acidoferrum sp.]
MRRKVTIVLIASMFLLRVPSFGKDTEITLYGHIEDSQCAFNVHADGGSHDKMMRMLKSKTTETVDESYCIRYCKEQMAGLYVLATEKHAYKLDDQVKPDKFIGKQVKITGILDEKNNLLHILTIDLKK